MHKIFNILYDFLYSYRVPVFSFFIMNANVFVCMSKSFLYTSGIPSLARVLFAYCVKAKPRDQFKDKNSIM